ncbi:isoamyl acetate-hydrolyzing esterase [Physocladia obscura]|uniref:Isoamyl acetate-hydrolyzing esterase n=1 Tax=Physocladia obscura TaxID=109957 RepID=A0AAD5T9T7_9FUNG|nr:isoamyl acetate-hydrolyzing esterase [Physocladia obscura]
MEQFAFDPRAAGWGLTLAHAYARKLDVVNRGFSGYNSEWSKHTLLPVLSGLPGAESEAGPGDAASGDSGTKVRLVVLFLGANDASLKARTAVALDRYVANVHKMLLAVDAAAPSARVVVVTPPPVHPAAWARVCLAQGKVPDRDVAHTRRYRDACIAAVDSSVVSHLRPKLRLLDSWRVFFGPDEATYDSYSMEVVDKFLCDGLHFSGLGNSSLGDALLRTISDSWPDLHPDALPAQFPPFESFSATQ